MSVGGFPGLAQARRRTVRAPTNPMDKSTIVSIFPKMIDELKPTISPGRFRIAPGSYEIPALLVVGSSSWWKEIDEEQPLLEIPNSSVQVADAIVKDYCNGLLGCDMREAMPGIFWIPGEYTHTSLKQRMQSKVEEAKRKQERFYTALIKMADSLWARTNGNPLVVSNDMRLAAKEMNVHSGKDWMKDFTITTEMSKCPACGSMRNADYPVCATCGAITDLKKAEALGIKFAQK